MTTVYLVLIAHDFVVVEIDGRLYEVRVLDVLGPYGTAAMVLKAPEEALKLTRASPAAYEHSWYFEVYKRPGFDSAIRKFASMYPDLVHKIHPEVRRIVGV